MRSVSSVSFMTPSVYPVAAPKVWVRSYFFDRFVTRMCTKPVRALSGHSAAPNLRLRVWVGEEREAAAIEPTPLGRHARGHQKFATGRSEDDTFDKREATLTYPSTESRPVFWTLRFRPIVSIG